MYLFLRIGDFIRLYSFYILIYQMKKNQSCVGVSLKTQYLYLMSFLLRYTSLFLLQDLRIFHSIMKILFLFLTIYIIYLIKYSEKISKSYDKSDDIGNIYIYLVSSIFISYCFYTEDVLWLASFILESISFTPQLIMIIRLKEVEVTSNYAFYLGFYRLSYLIHWILKCFSDFYFLSLPYLALIQIIIYLIFAYNCYKTKHHKSYYVTLPY
ncbi:unnamed protein product [Blepharisma stoltei]|uniref:ER lumen protein-retaining receptor n=1 Tax=Blepharisma stoltei TaxID=1481888 RepID=A0AAU9IV67_9CILI|nr:unnamed protein product [Blepharisma stoltei]